MAERCGLCGHNPACGHASEWKAQPTGPHKVTRLCHTDDHSCYHRWTVYGERPTKGEHGE